MHGCPEVCGPMPAASSDASRSRKRVAAGVPERQVERLVARGEWDELATGV